MQIREQWGSRLGFILAASGSAVGIGNIWKYPHMAGQNGGAAFTLVYLLCILVVGMTIVIAELAVGTLDTNGHLGGAFSYTATWFHADQFTPVYKTCLLLVLICGSRRNAVLRLW